MVASSQAAEAGVGWEEWIGGVRNGEWNKQCSSKTYFIDTVAEIHISFTYHEIDGF